MMQSRHLSFHHRPQPKPFHTQRLPHPARSGSEGGLGNQSQLWLGLARVTHLFMNNRDADRELGLGLRCGLRVVIYKDYIARREMQRCHYILGDVITWVRVGVATCGVVRVRVWHSVLLASTLISLRPYTHQPQRGPVGASHSS